MGRSRNGPSAGPRGWGEPSEAPLPAPGPPPAVGAPSAEHRAPSAEHRGVPRAARPGTHLLPPGTYSVRTNYFLLYDTLRVKTGFIYLTRYRFMLSSPGEATSADTEMSSGHVPGLSTAAGAHGPRAEAPSGARAQSPPSLRLQTSAAPRRGKCSHRKGPHLRFSRIDSWKLSDLVGPSFPQENVIAHQGPGIN